MFSEIKTELPSIEDVISGNCDHYSFLTTDCSLWFLNILAYCVSKTHKENDEKWKNEFHNIFTFINNNYPVDKKIYFLQTILKKYNINIVNEPDVKNFYMSMCDFILTI